MADFDRIEADRERNEGLVYEEWWENRIDEDEDDMGVDCPLHGPQPGLICQHCGLA